MVHILNRAIEPRSAPLDLTLLLSPNDIVATTVDKNK